VRILLDEQLPRQLARELTGHLVRTVQQEGWNGLGNGALLLRARATYEAFLTADQNMQFQQNLTGSQLRIVVLAAPSTALEDLQPLIPTILDTVASMQPGEVRVVAAP
jgi:predicted nuclease of predicted toxin-antitoxin system